MRKWKTAPNTTTSRRSSTCPYSRSPPNEKRSMISPSSLTTSKFQVGLCPLRDPGARHRLRLRPRHPQYLPLPLDGVDESENERRVQKRQGGPRPRPEIQPRPWEHPGDMAGGSSQRGATRDARHPPRRGRAPPPSTASAAPTPTTGTSPAPPPPSWSSPSSSFSSSASARSSIASPSAR